jgi:hypothetical protein
MATSCLSHGVHGGACRERLSMETRVAKHQTHHENGATSVGSPPPATRAKTSMQRRARSKVIECRPWFAVDAATGPPGSSVSGKGRYVLRPLAFPATPFQTQWDEERRLSRACQLVSTSLASSAAGRPGRTKTKIGQHISVGCVEPKNQGAQLPCPASSLAPQVR